MLWNPIPLWIPIPKASTNFQLIFQGSSHILGDLPVSTILIRILSSQQVEKFCAITPNLQLWLPVSIRHIA